MPITATSNSGTFEQPKEGTHLATCYKMIYLGTQKRDYQGNVSYPKKVIIGWELHDQKTSEDKPFVTSEFFTLSMSDMGKLKPFLESWRGQSFTEAECKEFDITKVLGKSCYLGLIKNAKDKINVKSAMPVPEGIEVPALTNEVVEFSFEDNQRALFDSFSDGIKKIIMESPEYKEWAVGVKPETDGNDEFSDDNVEDIPF